MKAAKCSTPPSARNCKKPRAMFSPHQLYMLDEYFATNNFPKAKEREEIATKLQICPHSVQIWFQNRRAKDRKQRQKMKDVNSKKFVPKPPSFWPKDLPFDSNLTEVIKQDKDGGKSSSKKSVSDTSVPPEPPQADSLGSSTSNLTPFNTHGHNQHDLGQILVSSDNNSMLQQISTDHNLFKSAPLQPQTYVISTQATPTSATNLPTPQIFSHNSSLTFSGQHNEAVRPSGISSGLEQSALNSVHSNNSSDIIFGERRQFVTDRISNSCDVTSKHTTWNKQYSSTNYFTSTSVPQASSSTNTELLHVTSDNAALHSSQGRPPHYQMQKALSAEVDHTNAQYYTWQRRESDGGISGQFDSFGGYQYQ